MVGQREHLRAALLRGFGRVGQGRAELGRVSRNEVDEVQS
jgi:hypothetical protein